MANASATARNARREPFHVLLWMIQILLAALFLFTGGMKLFTPLVQLTKQIALPGGLIRFLGVAEVAGGLGMILPGMLRIRTGLTPLAAAGLVVIMIGAVRFTLQTSGGTMALLPLIAGLLAAFVAYGRWRLAPLPRR